MTHASQMMITPSVLEAVLRLSFAPLFNARIAATRLCASLLPFAEPKLVDTQVLFLQPTPMTYLKPE